MSNFEKHNDTEGLEDFFTKNLYDASMQPSAKPWENIEAVLDLEEKRKKRILWFFLTGLVLLIGTTSVWFFLSDASSTISINTTDSKQKISETRATPKVPKSIEEPAIINTSKEPIVNTPILIETEQKSIAENKLSEVKIQLGAFSKKVTTNKFNDVPFNVQSETSEDGITRYFVVTANVTADLETIKQAGFKDAFIKRNSSAKTPKESDVSNHTGHSTNSINVKKNKSVTEQFQENNVLAPSKNKKSDNKMNDEESAESSLNVSTSINSANKTIPIKKNTTATSEVTNTSANNNSTPQANNSNSVKEITNTAIFTSSSTPIKAEQIKNQNNPIDTSIHVEPLATTKINVIDSLPQKEPTLETKTDSIKQIAKIDSIISPIKKPTIKDSTKITPNYRWAIALIGGPNVYLNQAKTQLFDSKSEKQATTYGGEIKVEYNFIKNLSASIGIGYQSHNIQKDSTFFRFYKFISTDYLVNSSFGAMAIDKSTLLQGYSTAGPYDSLNAAYKYTSTIQSINVPLQINWYFLNKSRIKLYSSIGMNVNYIISQQSHLTLIKEHHVDDIYYKTIQANKLNGLLLLSLGCDIRLTKRFYFTIAPSYRFALNNYSPVSGIIFKPSYISATGGFKFRF